MKHILALLLILATALPAIAGFTPYSTTATANRLCMRDANTNAQFGALTMGNVSAGVNNVGMGGAASASALYPLLAQRDNASPINFQLSNPNTGAGAGAKYQLAASNGNNGFEMGLFTPATAAPDAYNGGNATIRSTGTTAGIAYIADDSGAHHKFYVAGNAVGNKIVSITSSGLVLHTGSIATLGTVTSGTWNGSAIGISYGGTGQTSQTAAFDALAPTTTSGDISYYNGTDNVRLAKGSNGDVLTLAAGLPSWAAPGASTAPVLKKEIFAANGTFTIPTGTVSGTVFKFTVIGGGGGGGGGNASNGGGGGGGAGGTAIKWLSGLTAGNTIAVTVGSGGGGGGAATNGSTGNNSSIASGTETITTVTANGGAGAEGSTADQPTEGGAGGGTSNGDLNITGQAGTTGDRSPSADNGWGGTGGSSTLGGGGKGGDQNNSSDGDGVAGVFGGGGGGGGANTGTRNGNAGNGGNGLVVVEWVL